LFILAIEILAIQIRASDDLKGISYDYTSDNKLKTLQYADDITLFLNNEEEIGHALNIVKSYGNVSGTVVNPSKSEGLWLGSIKNRQQNCTLYDLKWPRDPIRYLGIYIGHNIESCDTLNWSNKIINIEKALNLWKQRDLTFFGKVNIIKTVGISKVLYSATCLPHNDICIKEINQKIFKFLWGKRDRIKRECIIGEVKDGGINMVDMESMFKAVKASWITRIINADIDDKWAVIPKYYLSMFGDENLILRTNIKSRLFLNTLISKWLAMCLPPP
jgi:hypothetical protein